MKGKILPRRGIKGSPVAGTLAGSHDRAWAAFSVPAGREAAERPLEEQTGLPALGRKIFDVGTLFLRAVFLFLSGSSVGLTQQCF